MDLKNQKDRFIKMASAIKCDKCGMASTKTEYFRHIRVHEMANATSYVKFANESFEVCKKCYDEIFNFKKESEEE